MPRSVTAPTPRLHLLPSQHREIAKKLANYIPPKSLNPQRGEDKFLESIWELMVRMDAERREIEEAWRDDSSLDEDELEEIRRMRKDVERMVRREQELGRVYMEMGLDDDDEEDGKGAEGYEGGDEGEGEEGDGESGEGEEGEEEKGEEEVGDKLASAAALALAAKYHGKTTTTDRSTSPLAKAAKPRQAKVKTRIESVLGIPVFVGIQRLKKK